MDTREMAYKTDLAIRQTWGSPQTPIAVTVWPPEDLVLTAAVDPPVELQVRMPSGDAFLITVTRLSTER